MSDYKITNIRSISDDKLTKYFSMSTEEQLNEFQKIVNYGRVMEDTIVFTPGLTVETDFSESKRMKSLAPTLSYSGFGWRNLNPEIRNNIVNGKKRAEQIISNLKHQNKIILFFKNIIKKVTK